MALLYHFLIALSLLSPPPALSARWDSADSATIQWTQTTRGCLYRESATHEHVFIECVERAGTIVLTLGGPETDAAYRPTSGDVFVLWTPEGVANAPLRGRDVYLPIFY